MNINILSGLLLIAAGAFTAGSFAVPFGKIRSWKWETYWMVYSFGAYILFPFISCLVLAPGSIHTIRNIPVATLITVFVLGAVYGIGNLSFGLALRYLGLSLGYSISLGLMLAIGTIIPPATDGRLGIMIRDSGGKLLILGVLASVLGIALSARAGILKDRVIPEAGKKESIREFDLVKGVLAAVLVGITGSAMSLGFEKGIPISDLAAVNGTDPLFTILPVMVILLSGTFVTTILWCLFLGIKNKSINDYLSAETTKVLLFNYLFGLLAGVLWFSQFIVYGMGKSRMGPYTFTSWGILMALTIVFSNIWGIIRKEWKGAPVRVFLLMTLALLIIIISSLMIGISGSI
jgi:L-rhamnose-H+ transport protein